MGLDMYLSAHRYVSGWDHASEAEQKMYSSVLESVGMKGFRCPEAPGLRVNVNVAYWRKSNQIHKWFVDHCQDGVDQCQESGVEREKLEELKTLCETVLESKDSTALPPQSGFFFGSTEIGDWYWEDLRDTVKQLKAVLENPVFKADWSFYYRSSLVGA